MKHYLSFDVEDVYQSFKERGIPGWRNDVKGETSRLIQILDTLDLHNTKATFFVLTEIVGTHRGILREIHARGHEIASHGHEHIRIWKRSQQEFAEDIKKSKAILEELLNEPILGYRAPGFSLNYRTLWAVDHILEAGFIYSSSSNFGKRQFAGIFGGRNREGNRELIEFPSSSVGIGSHRFRLAGGFAFRLMPLSVTSTILKGRARLNSPANLYLHPFEFEASPERIRCPKRVQIVRYLNLDKTQARFSKLLDVAEFIPFRDSPHLPSRSV